VMNIIEMLMKLVPSQTCLLYTLEISEGQQELYPDGGASPYLEFLRNYTIKQQGDQFFVAATAMAGRQLIRFLTSAASPSDTIAFF